MKLTGKKILSLFTAVAMVATMATTAFAADTVQIDGYAGDMDASQLSISNVTKVDTAYINGVPTYTSTGPVTVSTTADLFLFVVSRLMKQEDFANPGSHSWVEAEYLHEAYEMAPKGSTYTLKEAGVYYIVGRYEALAGAAEAVVVIGDGGAATTPPAPPADDKITASPTSSKVLVNGAAVEFDAYTINGNNYFKLRDVAKVVSGSDNQFEVTWDGAKNAINLISNAGYTVVGGELAKGDGAPKDAVACTSALLKDGTAVTLTAYTINGNNYFKLRDLGHSFNFDVSWDGANNCITIDTTQSYTDD